MNEDGTMAKGQELFDFANKHKLKIGKIEDLIAYRLRNEKLILKSHVKKTKTNNFEFIIYENKLNNSKNYVIKKGNFNKNKSIRVRVISINIKNSKLILKNLLVKKSLKYLMKFKNFALVIISKEVKEKNEKENLTLRYYGIGAQIIKDLKVKNMILVTRTRKKIIGLEGFGLKIKKQEIIK